MSQAIPFVSSLNTEYVSFIDSFKYRVCVLDSNDSLSTDILGCMCEVPPLFKVWENFEVHEFDKFASLVCPIIRDNAHSTEVERVISGRLMKLTLAQSLFNFIMYLKHDNIMSYESFQWNVACSTLCNDVNFIALCINNTLPHKISSPDEVE